MQVFAKRTECGRVLSDHIVPVTDCLPVTDLVLASASPRRADLLRQIGVRFIRRPANIDETPQCGEHAYDYVRRMACTKANVVYELLESLPGETALRALPVLGADTIVVSAGQLYAKPSSREDAIDTLLALSGRCHQVLSAVALRNDAGTESLVSETTVCFNDLGREQCERYWATGEPAGKAGAYAIQGLGAAFVKSIAGSYSGVVGLPLAETVSLLEKYGVAYWHTS